MTLLRQRVARGGYDVRQFHYHSMSNTPAESAARLDEFLAGIAAPTIHFVAHSLGGIVLCHLYDIFPPEKPGRVVMLGTPINRSRVADAYVETPGMNLLLKKSCKDGLLGGHPGWHGATEAGMVAGNKGIGIGMLLMTQLPEPHDGTVSVDETRCEAMADSIDLPHSHMGMLMSTEVADQVLHFLEQGVFEHSGRL